MVWCQRGQWTQKRSDWSCPAAINLDRVAEMSYKTLQIEVAHPILNVHINVLVTLAHAKRYRYILDCVGEPIEAQPTSARLLVTHEYYDDAVIS